MFKDASSYEISEAFVDGLRDVFHDLRWMAGLLGDVKWKVVWFSVGQVRAVRQVIRVTSRKFTIEDLAEVFLDNMNLTRRCNATTAEPT